MHLGAIKDVAPEGRRMSYPPTGSALRAFGFGLSGLSLLPHTSPDPWIKRARMMLDSSKMTDWFSVGQDLASAMIKYEALEQNDSSDKSASPAHPLVSHA